jgi:hypothetical protein
MNSRDGNDLQHAAGNADAGPRGALSPLRRIQFAVMAMLILFWSAVVVIVVTTFALTAWSDRGSSQPGTSAGAERTATPSPEASRPTGVPASAQMVESDVVLGDISDAIYFFRDSQCLGSLLIVSTTKALIYAETPCANRISPEDVRRLIGQPVRIRLVSQRLFIEALFVNSYQFDVERVWVDAR